MVIADPARLKAGRKEKIMADYTKYNGWKIEVGAGDGSNLPQGYHVEVYADTAAKRIYTSDLLSDGWWTEGNTDKHLCNVEHPHPYYGKPDHYTRAELVAMAVATATL